MYVPSAELVHSSKFWKIDMLFDTNYICSSLERFVPYFLFTVVTAAAYTYDTLNYYLLIIKKSGRDG
jgi:hypothetical protein